MKILISLTLVLSIGTIPLQMLFGQTNVEAASRHTGGVNVKQAPVAVSGDNVHVSWWSNKTGNDEVLFRSSTDGGATITDKVNLSNTTNAESVDAMISANGDTVAVTWWERNSTANEPVMRISNDAGQTFGPLLQLSQNGTLGTSLYEEQE